MIDESVLTRALETVFNNTAALSTVTIERGTRINFEPGKCPWLGIYPGQVDTKPKTLGMGNAKWASVAVPQVVIQTVSFDGDGQTASDQLETLVQAVQVAVNSDLTIGVAGARIVAVSREYRYVVFDSDESGNLFMPQVIIKFTMEVRSS